MIRFELTVGDILFERKYSPLVPVSLAIKFYESQIGTIDSNNFIVLHNLACEVV